MKPLAGVRVLDLTQAYSGPFCTMHLADHGAEVIKIERPGVGDQCRGWGPFVNDYSGYFAYINRNKKGITLDLEKQEGKEVLKKLIEKADVICENYRVGTMEKLGFDYETMKAINPKIIYASISGFGLNGPLKDRRCYDIVAQAMSGMMSVTGFPERPTKIGPSVGDNYSGSYLCIGILMALFQREKTGEGQRLDVAMLDTLYSVMENLVVEYTIAGKVPERVGNIDPSIAPFDSFRAKDGEFVMGCGTNKLWATICKLMGREELIDDPRYDSNAKRCDNYLPDIKDAIEAWSMTKTLVELEELIAGAGIPFGNILNLKEISDHPQIAARNMLWDVYDTGMQQTVRIPGTPIKIHGQLDAASKSAPLLGEDTEQILKELVGVSDEEYNKLRDANIV